MTEIDEPYKFGQAKQKVDGTGPFNTRELSKLLMLKGEKEIEIKKNLRGRKYDPRERQ